VNKVNEVKETIKESKQENKKSLIENYYWERIIILD
jgi:hypothetical protein